MTYTKRGWSSDQRSKESPPEQRLTATHAVRPEDLLNPKFSVTQMSTDCKPGDPAIVIDAYNTSNLGMIVRVVGHQDLSSDLVIHDESGVWVIESPHLMAWAIA